MTATHENCKEQQLQRRMAAKKSDRKERWLQENNDCNKAMTPKNRHCKEQFWKEVSPESFVSTSSTCRFWRRSRTKASFSHLQGSSHESFLFTPSICRFFRRLARKLPLQSLHNFNLQVLKEVSHKNFVFISLQLDHGEKMRRTTDPSLASQ